MAANYTVPPIIGQLRLNNGRVATFYETERGSYERALASGATPVGAPPADTTVVDGKQVATTENVLPSSDTVTTSESQATPQPSTPPTQPGSTNARDDGPTQAPTSGGVGAGKSSNSADSRGPDDTPPPSRSANQQAINQNFGNQIITPRPNELDQYASYTYAISWWLLTPDQYNKLASGRAPAPGTGNWSLLVQSGGAPIAGRNQFFPDDYYLDDLEIETFLMGKGTNMSTNGIEIRFKVVEPNGLTLIQNLYSAVVAAYKQGNVSTGQVPNYAAAQYCLTIEFYGYDSQGNLVAPARAQGTTGAGPVIKKYYPFLLRNITFRTVANQIEYNIIANAIPYETGTAQARGTIPFSFALAGTTVGQLLQGGPLAPANNEDGRISNPAPAGPTPSPTASVNDIRVNAGVNAFGNFTGETQNPNAVVAP
jgi:hypothetical protein